MKKVFSSFQEMMAVVRGNIEEIEPEEYKEPFEDLEEKPLEEQPKKKKRRKKEDE